MSRREAVAPRDRTHEWTGDRAAAVRLRCLAGVDEDWDF